MKNKTFDRLVPFLFFGLAFFALPVSQLGSLTMMPGDLGDARLNNYFLENFYLFFAGRSDSLWHLGFFYPFPFVLGFSDNLFGSAPFYLLLRLLSGHSDTAFQLWFYFGYAANFSSAYYALRRLGGSRLAASIGALIFTFSLPTSAKAIHAQLHYRFALPLALVFYINFLESKQWRFLVVSTAWTVWQFYCGVYMGFFTLLLLAAMGIAYLLVCKLFLKKPLLSLKDEFLTSWRVQTHKEKTRVLLGMGFLFSLLVLLFYPYLQVSHLYGAKRSWQEIVLMLPRPQSYFLSDASKLWSWSDSKVFATIPMRHEHQLFAGGFAMLLAMLGVFSRDRARNKLAFPVMAGAFCIVVAITLSIGGYSLWYFFYKLPMASAIRAMTRVELALLFPMGFFAGQAIDFLFARKSWGKIFVWLVLLPLIIFEFSATTMGVSPKDDWRNRLKAAESKLPKDLPDDAVVFFAQGEGAFWLWEIDAMWASLNHGIKTLNGYSGLFPPGYSLEYGTDCWQLPKRVAAYLTFKGLSGDSDAFSTLMKRTVPVGFEECNMLLGAETPITVSQVDREYTADEFRKLHYRFGEKHVSGAQTSIDLKIFNSGSQPFAAISGLGKPIRISWRFLDVNGNPVTGWDNRKELPFDISAKGSITVSIPINAMEEVKGGTLQVSLVQELVFWAHDIGMQPISMAWN